jgi:hypothetical protein
VTERTDLETITDGVLPINPDSWWNQEADDVEGFDLLKNDALLDLVGVPFAAFKAVYRVGIQRKGAEWHDDYLSLEVRVAPYSVLTRDLVRINTRRAAQDKNNPPPLLTFDDCARLGGEQLVLNDGSSGLYRQITEYLEAKGYMTLPQDMPKIGGKGDSRYDTPRSMWDFTNSPASVDIRFDVDGQMVDTEFPIMLRCSRGLRYSDYTNEYTGGEKARTWYIA